MAPTEGGEPAGVTRASRASTNISGVDIMPMPPALEFPYPTESDLEAEEALGPSSPQALQEQQEQESASYFDPPKKSATEPIAPRGRSPSQRQRTSPTTPGLLERIGSAPIRPSGPRKSGTERPVPLARPSLLRTLSKKQTSAYFDPTILPEHEESSDEEEDSGEPSAGSQTQGGRTGLRRTVTAPMKKPPSPSPYRRFALGNRDYQTRGHVSKHDGRLNISLRETANKGYLAKALGASLEHHLAPALHRQDSDKKLSPLGKEDQTRPKLPHRNTASTISNLSIDDSKPIPKLNIVVMVIGSRGDIQPFLRLGKILKEDHGHRVRIATHPTFKKFVEEDAKLEFFNVGGDPAELMAFMVKNPGLIPKSETLRSGEIPRRRAQMFEMFKGFWRACVNSTDDESNPDNRALLEKKPPFVADAIIANPPCFAHIHCAERLGIPLHLMFTFPNTPTQQFPHPLTNIRQTNVDANYTNFMSYPLVEMMQWQGLGDLINEFRVKTLGLDPMSMLWAPGQLFRMKVPYSYLWSPGLIPKPADWGTEINITGFVFLDLASSFKPPDPLREFLEAGEAPIYIGFGSIVVDDPDKFTHLIFEAVKKAGVRALVNKGWGGLGGEQDTPENIFMLDNTPHDWLFPRVKAVVHHGGAGTTAIGLKCGKPTMIVPFFGDQPFWGAMVAKANAGPEPVPYKQLSSSKLAEGIEFLLSDEAQSAAQGLAKRIADEGDGAVNAVKSFHKRLPRHGPNTIRCSVLQERVAVWQLKGTDVHLCALAAHILIDQRKITYRDLRLLRAFDWNDFEGPGEPLSGAGSSLLASLMSIGTGIGKVPYHWGKVIKRKEKYDRKRRQQTKRSLEQDVQQNSQKQSEDRSKEGVEEQPHNTRRRDISPSEQKENRLRSEGGQGGLENILPGGNEPLGASHQPGLVERSHQTDSTTAEDSEDEEEAAAAVVEQLAEETARGIRQSGGALLKLPMDLSLALARGFHNAPRLYGDSTVRTTRRVTGFNSGLRAARDEFFLGVWDAFSGVVRQPYNGAKQEGSAGFFKGVAKGAGGFVLKDLAAVFSVPAYTLKGVHKEVTKYRQPTAFIRWSRTVEGRTQFGQLSENEQQRLSDEVDEAWYVIEDVRLEIQRTIKENGLRGRLQVWRSRRWLKENGVLENIKGMRRALEAKRAGRDWEVEFREEKERHQRELARAHRMRKEQKRKRFEKDEKGHRANKTPDVRMKTRGGIERALLKGARSDKHLRKEQPAPAQKSEPTRQAQMRAAMGVAAMDQATQHEGKGQHPAAADVSQPSANSEVRGRGREDSNDTLVHPPPDLSKVATEKLGTKAPDEENPLATKGQTAGQVTSDPIAKSGVGGLSPGQDNLSIPKVAGPVVDGHGFLARMVTA